MDPNALTSSDWTNISNWLTLYWIYFPIIIVFAFTIMTAHAFIPSACNTGHLPPSFRKLRLPMTIFAVGLLAVAVLMMINIMFLLEGTLSGIYDRFFI